MLSPVDLLPILKGSKLLAPMPGKLRVGLTCDAHRKLSDIEYRVFTLLALDYAPMDAGRLAGADKGTVARIQEWITAQLRGEQRG